MNGSTSFSGAPSGGLNETGTQLRREPFQTLDRKPWGKTEWNSLISSIREHNVIPVIGPELITIEVAGKHVPLYTILAEKLAERFELPNPTQNSAALHEVVCHYRRQDSTRSPSDLLPELCQIMSELKPEPSPALLQLAEIRGFTMFICTTPDLLLEQALSNIRFAGRDVITSLEYSLNCVEDLPIADKEIKIQGNFSPPVVFHPFGKLSASSNSCVLSEEDLLEVFYHFQRESKRLENLLMTLRNRQLLFLGAAWPDWFARFFLRNAHEERFTKKDQMDYVVGDNLAGEGALVSFLQDFANRTRIPARDPIAFIAALRDRWVERYPPGPAEPIPLPAKMRPFSIFISYAREDLLAVEQLRAGLEEAGLEVWFDKRQLTAGVSWQQKIMENLRTCLLFMPVISKNTEAAVSDRFFREEWTQAVERARRSDESYEFILPVQLDNGPHFKVPEKFMERQQTVLPGGKVSPEFIVAIKDLIARQETQRHG